MSPGTGAIRAAGPGDADALEQLERDLFGSDRAAAAARNPGDTVRVLVAEGVDGVVHGFVSYRLVVDELEIVDVGVRADRRRRGVAKALLGALLDGARRAGAGRAVLEVGESNAAALALYRGLGFVPCGRRPGYYRSGSEAARVLERALT